MDTVLAAATFAEFIQRLRAIDIDVPFHPKDRDNDRVEAYSLVAVLKAIPWDSDCFPLEICRSERPDFLIKYNSTLVGLEHTEAIPQNLAKERAIRADGNGPDTHYVELAWVHDQPMTGREILAKVEADEMGGGFFGDSVERSWAEAIAHFMEKKAASAKKDGYKLYAENWLMIYDNWPGSGLNHHKALAYLRQHLVDSSALSMFNRVFIVDESVVIEISTDVTRYHNLGR